MHYGYISVCCSVKFTHPFCVNAIKFDTVARRENAVLFAQDSPVCVECLSFGKVARPVLMIGMELFGKITFTGRCGTV